METNHIHDVMETTHESIVRLSTGEIKILSHCLTQSVAPTQTRAYLNVSTTALWMP